MVVGALAVMRSTFVPFSMTIFVFAASGRSRISLTVLERSVTVRYALPRITMVPSTVVSVRSRLPAQLSET